MNYQQKNIVAWETKIPLPTEDSVALANYHPKCRMYDSFVLAHW